MPSIAKRSIFVTGYLVLPEKRSSRSYVDADLIVTNPAHHPAQKTMPFGRTLERVDDAPAHQAKIAGVDRDRNFREAPDHAVEESCGKQLEWALALARAAHGVDDVVALTPFRHKLRDELGRILEIAVHQDHGVTLRDVHTGRRGKLVTEIAGEVDDHDMLAARKFVANAFERAIGAAVVDQDNLIGRSAFQTPDDRHNALDERRDVTFLVVQGYDDAEYRHDRSASTRARRTFGMQRPWAIFAAALVLSLAACAQRVPAPRASVESVQTATPVPTATQQTVTSQTATPQIAAAQTAGPLQSATPVHLRRLFIAGRTYIAAASLASGPKYDNARSTVHADCSANTRRFTPTAYGSGECPADDRRCKYQQSNRACRGYNFRHGGNVVECGKR